MSEWNKGGLALVRTPQAFLYNAPGVQPGPQTDEVLSGWAVAIEEGGEGEWVPVRTHYGYAGWIRTEALRRTDRAELEVRKEIIRRVAGAWMDLYAEPKVQGKLIATLPRGSFVRLTGEDQEGWSPVRDAEGREGWAHTAALAVRRDEDGYLLSDCDPAWFRRSAERMAGGRREPEIRQAVADAALSYLGAPYRWGGKTPGGIDCSGLAFMSYMENGILIYRDARIMPEYPIREIPPERLGTGDLIFFPGHVAVCIGGGRYVHATAWKHTPWVTVNSLNPGDPDFRADLAGKAEAFGSLFVHPDAE